jgi:hypothetical protein
MVSDEELGLISEVDDLETQLKHAGDPINTTLSEVTYRSIQTKSTAVERVPKWNQRVTYLKQKLERASARAAVSRGAGQGRVGGGDAMRRQTGAPHS